jgi:hypothetical protein
VSVVSDPSAEPFIAALTATTTDELTQDIEQSLTDPQHAGRLLIRAALGHGTKAVCTFAYNAENRRSRIAHLRSLVIEQRTRRTPRY